MLKLTMDGAVRPPRSAIRGITVVLPMPGIPVIKRIALSCRPLDIACSSPFAGSMPTRKTRLVNGESVLPALGVGHLTSINARHCRLSKLFKATKASRRGRHVPWYRVKPVVKVRANAAKAFRDRARQVQTR